MGNDCGNLFSHGDGNGNDGNDDDDEDDDYAGDAGGDYEGL